MTIHNDGAILSYSSRMAVALEGAPAAGNVNKCRPIRVPLLAQINNFAIGTYDTDGDTVGVEVDLPDGTTISEEVVRAAGAPADATAAAVALAAAINANVDFRNVATAAASTTNVILTFDHENIAYVVRGTASAGTTMTATTTQSAGGTAIPFGRFVQAGATVDGQPLVTLPDGSDTEADWIGVTQRPHGQFANAGSALSTAVDGIEAGSMGDVCFDGVVYMRNVSDDTDAVPGGLVFVVQNTAGGNNLGEARADDDAANTIPVARARAYWAEAVAAGAIGPVYLRM